MSVNAPPPWWRVERAVAASQRRRPSVGVQLGKVAKRTMRRLVIRCSALRSFTWGRSGGSGTPGPPATPRVRDRSRGKWQQPGCAGSHTEPRAQVMSTCSARPAGQRAESFIVSGHCPGAVAHELPEHARGRSSSGVRSSACPYGYTGLSVGVQTVIQGRRPSGRALARLCQRAEAVDETLREERGGAYGTPRADDPNRWQSSFGPQRYPQPPALPASPNDLPVEIDPGKWS